MILILAFACIFLGVYATFDTYGQQQGFIVMYFAFGLVFFLAAMHKSILEEIRKRNRP